MIFENYLQKNRLISLVFLFLPVTCHFSCNLSKEEKQDPEVTLAQAQRLGYDLANPTKKILLHYNLEEISGLSLVENGQLACVQDELGRVYFYDLSEKKITSSIKFGRNGDYEGVEFINGTIYVTESDGTLHHFDPAAANGGRVQATIVKTPLTIQNNVEGLGFLPSARKLLIACKGNAGIEGNKVKGKAVYAYDLDENRFEKQPFLTLTKGDVTDFITKNPDNYDIDKAPGFKPSGIAVHPETNQIYLLNSAGKLLIILNVKGEIQDLAVLNPKLFRQPEGICFAPNGDLYIANEGAGGRGYILTFDYLKGTPPKL